MVFRSSGAVYCDLGRIHDDALACASAESLYRRFKIARRTNEWQLLLRLCYYLAQGVRR